MVLTYFCPWTLNLEIQWKLRAIKVQLELEVIDEKCVLID